MTLTSQIVHISNHSPSIVLSNWSSPTRDRFHASRREPTSLFAELPQLESSETQNSAKARSQTSFNATKMCKLLSKLSKSDSTLAMAVDSIRYTFVWWSYADSLKHSLLINVSVCIEWSKVQRIARSNTRKHINACSKISIKRVVMRRTFALLSLMNSPTASEKASSLGHERLTLRKILFK